MNESPPQQPVEKGRAVLWMERMRSVLPPLWRLVAVVLICWLMREHHTRLRLEGDAPLELREAREFWEAAAALRPDPGPHAGFHVLNESGERIGYLVRTMPEASQIVGYCGTTDTLVALDPDDTVKGIRVRSSEDTIRHAEDVMLDWSFKRTWNDMNWSAVAGMDLKAEGIEGVSGATLTSMAVARGIVHRFAVAEGRTAKRPVVWRMTDVGLLGAVVMGLFLTFTRSEGRARARRWFHLYVIGYVGFLAGDLLSQSLLLGWAQSGAAWRVAPGLALLASVSLLAPWISGRPVYCQQLCPHGALQEVVLKVSPRRWRRRLPGCVDTGLRRLPGFLLGFLLLVSMLPLGFELADFEPFDAYALKWVGGATAVVAVVGLVLSAFIPKAYCRYGCPTGALLEFVRSSGGAGGFGWRDMAALLLVSVVLGVHGMYPWFRAWLNTF